MRAVSRFFWELFTTDPWRKLGSIGLALFLWIYVHQRITGEMWVTLTIRGTSIDSWESEPGFLYVRVPPGKILQTYPAPANQVKFLLKGTNRELNALTGPMRAFFDPRDEKGELKVDSVGVAIDKISWDRPQVPGLLSGIEPKQFNLNFENIEKTDLVLKPEMLDVQGTPPEGFAVYRDQAYFVPTAVKIFGPKSAIEKLNRGEFGAIFRSISIRKDDTTSPQSFLLDFTDNAQKENLTAEGVRAFVPIKPRVQELPFRARIYPVATGDRADELLRIYKLQGSSAEHSWIEVAWIAEIPGTLKSEVTEAWIRENVRFQVDLGAIYMPEDASSAAIEVKELLLLAPADRPRFEEIRFRPSDPVRAKVIVEKK